MFFQNLQSVFDWSWNSKICFIGLIMIIQILLNCPEVLFLFFDVTSETVQLYPERNAYSYLEDVWLACNIKHYFRFMSFKVTLQKNIVVFN